MDLVDLEDMDAYASQLESQLLEEEVRRSGNQFEEGSSGGASARPPHWSPALSDFDIDEQRTLLDDIQMHHSSSPEPSNPGADVGRSLFSEPGSPEAQQPVDGNGYLSFDDDDAEILDKSPEARSPALQGEEPADVTGYLSFEDEASQVRVSVSPKAQAMEDIGYLSFEEDADEADPAGYLSMDEAFDEENPDDGNVTEEEHADASNSEVEIVGTQRVRFRTLQPTITIGTDSEDSDSSPPPEGRIRPLRYPIPYPRAALITEDIVDPEDEERLQALVEEYNESFIAVLQLSITRRFLHRALVHINSSIRNARRDG